MVLNVTEEQKKLIESQGYMVIEFKLWIKKQSEALEYFRRVVIDGIKSVILFIQDTMSKAIESIKHMSKLVEGLELLIDRVGQKYEYRPRRKYSFVRSLGRKYEVNYSRVTIYHRCRDRC